MADLEGVEWWGGGGGGRGLLEPPFETRIFYFRGEFSEKSRNIDK